jgi:hypothetical protein
MQNRAPYFLTLLFAIILSAAASQSFDLETATTTMNLDNSSRNELSIKFDFPNPQIESINGQNIYRLEGEGLIGEPGAPDLPLVNRFIRIPANTGVVVDIIHEEWINMGQVDVRPEQDRLHTDADLPLEWVINEDIYNSNNYWPRSYLTTSEPMLLRNVRLVTLSINPIRWNPGTHELQKLNSIEVMLTWEGDDRHNNPICGPTEDGEGLVYDMQRRAEDRFVEDLTGGTILNMSLNNEVSYGGQLSEIDWATQSIPLNYTIFGKNAAINNYSVQQFIKWKRRKGHHVSIYTENDLTWSRTGIRNVIVDDYNNSDYPPHYVLLIGDVDDTYALPTHSSQYDHYYSTIVGNDILADVVVGRISVDSSTQLTTVMNKILNYETSPYLDDVDWLQRASFLTGSGHCGISMKQMSRSIAIQLVEERGYQEIDTAWCASSPSYVYNWYNQGITYHTYRGWIGMEGLSINQVQNLSQGPKTPIAVIFTCSSGEFASTWDDPTYTEAFLRAGNAAVPGGAVAAMGFCTSMTHTAYNNLVTAGFYSGMLDYNIPQVGTCMFRGKLELALNLPPNDSNTTNFSYWANLMGDPGMEMWCGVPDQLQFAYIPETVIPGSNLLRVIVQNQDGIAVPGAAICASQTDGINLIRISDSEGNVYIPLPELLERDLMVTATHPGMVPVMADLTTNVFQAVPVLQSIEIIDENEDGMLVPGETATIIPVFQNYSDAETLAELGLSLSLVAGSGEVLSANTILESLAPAESGSPLGQLEIQVSDDWTSGQTFELIFMLSNQSEEFSIYYELDISTPVFGEIQSLIDGSTISPGDSREVQIRAKNIGTTDATNVQFTASFLENSGMSVTIPETSLSEVLIDDVGIIFFEVNADETLVPGYHTLMEISWLDESGATGIIDIPITLGDLQAGDPTGPDEYGYYAYEDSDSDWALAPEYNWLEIAPNAGGSGIEVDLDDNGNEQDDAVRIDLPFFFVLYGEVYQQMSICSNGFVAFGPNAHLETDFRNHYLPCSIGPEPMLAPMWDDHKIISDAQVCYEYFEDLGILVIEWYKVRTNSNNRVNTFQILLYDPAVYPTLTGDGDVLFQYHTFDDSQSADQDFPYCSIGLKDHLSLRGLTLLNYHQQPSTVTNIQSGSAIALTTNVSGIAPPPVAVLVDPEMIVNISADEAETVLDSLSLRNDGDGILFWTAGIERIDDIDLSTGTVDHDRDSGGPDSYGYSWVDSNEESGPDQGWVNNWDSSNIVEIENNDDSVGPFELGFDFSFYGESFSQFWINANGMISFNEISDGFWNNSVGIPDDEAANYAIYPWWDDLMPNGANYSQYIRYLTNNSDSLVVTWNNTDHYNGANYGGPFSFQIVCEANGKITLNYGDMADSDQDSDSGTIGIRGSASETLVIQHMDQSVSQRTVKIRLPYWTKLSQLSGIVAPGTTDRIPLEFSNLINGILMPEGIYTANLHLQTNDADNLTFVVPITMQVTNVDVDNQILLPQEFSLSNAYPNPFNPSTVINYYLPTRTNVRATVYNVLGQKVMQPLLYESMSQGNHSLTIDGSILSSGLYLLQVDAGDKSEVRKLILLK